MNDNTIETRLERLEVRYSHQEQALEEVTRSLLAQEQQLKHQQALIERLELALKALDTSGGTPAGEERPPHY